MLVRPKEKYNSQFDRSEGAEVSDGAQQVLVEPISRSVIGRKFASAFDGWNGIGTKSHCQTEKCLGLCFFTKNLNEPLKVVSLRTAIDATIHQDAEFGRRLVALVEQLIETVKRQFNGDFHWPRRLLVLFHKCNWYCYGT